MKKNKDMNAPTDKEVYNLLKEYLELFNDHKHRARIARLAQTEANKIKSNLIKLSREVRRKLKISGWKGPFVFAGDKNHIVLEITSKAIHVTGATTAARLNY